jgi:hypothetical protein
MRTFLRNHGATALAAVLLLQRYTAPISLHVNDTLLVPRRSHGNEASNASETVYRWRSKTAADAVG